MSAPVFTNHLEDLRQRVMGRMASLLESQTRSRAFASNLGALVRQVQSEVMAELEALAEEAMPQNLALRLRHVIDTYRSLEQTMALLLSERQRQWSRNADHAKTTLLEFNQTVTDLASTLIEKDLFERQSRVLERIILSHEHVAQWKAFVQEILADFHAIFPFNFFYIAFAEEHGLALNLYYLGTYSDDRKKSARELLSRQMLVGLNLPPDTLLEIDEFEISVPDHHASVEDIRMITVAVPEHTPRLAGLLGVAYVGSNELTPQEESVVRSILSVMVMVVGSSKLLSRTMSELEYYAMHDPLTGLYNRRQFSNMLDYEFGRSERHNHEFSLLLLDLDDFKDINDSYGHQVGDDALRGVAEVLRAQVRKGDIAARIGGDEFAVLLMETGRNGATSVAEMLGRVLRERSFIAPNGNRFHLTVSIGIAVYPSDAINEVDILAGADQAMYRAKEMGKDGACTLDSIGEAALTSKKNRDYAEQLRSALHNNRIIPYFQSIVDCRSGELFACETLARMVEPNGSILSAGQFIDTIEKYGMGRELDRIVIRKALETLRARILSGVNDIKVFLNLSAQEIQGRGVLAYAEDLCKSLCIPPQCIVFEILERDAIGDMTNMRTFLTQLRSRGFSFALDDFGSGYNSFHYLRELRFDYVKIDGAFVRNILKSKIDFALVHNLSRLCQDLGIKTVAEFVEDEKIFSVLREMGVDYAQGYYIGIPGERMSI